MNTVTRTYMRGGVDSLMGGVSRLSSIIRSVAAMVVFAFVLSGSAYAQVTFSGAPYSVDEDAGSVLITLDFTMPTGSDLVISYYTANGTALVDEDYTETTGTFTIAAGTAAGSRNFSVPIVNDGIGEDWITGAGTEDFTVNITYVGGGLGGSPAMATVTITDDESIGEISINDASAAEGGSAVFTISNTIPQDEAFMATFGCTLGTAEAADFDGGSCSATAASFLVGQTSTTSVVEYDEDNIYEEDENYEITIVGSADYTIGDGVGNGIIINNDSVPEISVNDASASEGAGTMGFTLTASHPAEAPYDIDLTYIDLTATAGNDYSAAPVMVTMAGAPAVTAPLAVPIADDADVEGVEVFAVRVVDGILYDLGDETGSGTIMDNDGLDLEVTASLDVTELDLDGGVSMATLTVVVTNNGDADATADATLDFDDVGFDGSGASIAHTGGNASCVGPTDIETATCTIDAADLTSGGSVTFTVTLIVGDGAPSTAASITASVSTTETETDLTNNAATDTATLVGLDFGDHDTAGDTDLAGGGAYHRLTNGMHLGASVDAEPDGVESGAADGDDTAGVDDEDGVVLLTGSTVYHSVANYFGVTASEGGYLSAFMSSGGPSALLDVVLVDDMPVVPGMNWVEITPPAFVGTNNIRFRYCKLENSCDTFGGGAPNGEVEDHQYTFAVAVAATELTIPAGTAEPTIIEATGTNEVIVKDGNGDVMFDSTLDNDPLTINGNENANTFVLDVAGFSADFQLTLDGLGGSDALEINDTGASTFGTVTHLADNAHNGEIAIGARMDVFYDNFEPILDNLDVNNRVFTFSANDDDIVLRDNGSLIDGLSFIDSGFAEAYTFANPNTTLTVNAEDGDDTIDFQGVDESNAAAFAITFNGGMGQDHFSVVPFPNTAAVSIAAVNGNDPGVCQGDVLDMNTANGAVVDTSTLVAGAGTVLFTSAHAGVAYTGIEGFGDHSADVQLEMVLPDLNTVTTGDNITVILKVTNNGPDLASCVVVDDISMGNNSLINITGETYTQGSLNGTEWQVGPLAQGAMATITYDAVVGYEYNGTATITALSPESDPDLTNNSVSLVINPAFFFPVKAQATAAVWFDQGLGENLIVGTANGFAGLNSSVLCRVDTFGGIFPENLWRECGEGLPYPLYVNDMFVDDQGTIDNDDDVIWLASWGSAGLYMSTDGGETFTAAEPVLGPKGGWANVYAITQDVDGFLYISTNHGFLYRSLNNGGTWQQIGSLPEVDADTPWSLTTHPTEQGRIYAGTFGRGVYTSDDYGFTWSFLGGDAVNGLLIAANGGHAFDLELDPTGSYMFAATGAGVFRMELDADGDAVGIWQQLDTEVTLDDGQVVTPEARSLSFDMNGHLYVTTWGFGAFFSAAPTLPAPLAMAQIALRGEQVTFVSVSPSGEQVAFGSVTGGVTVIDAPSATSTDVEDETVGSDLPTEFALEQNYPNPFNPVTTISFSLKETSRARLAVYDVLGREVAILVDGQVQAGQHNVQFDAMGLTTGTYIYRLETDKGAFSRQLVLMK